jgi:hypothetical protein
LYCTVGYAVISGPRPRCQSSFFLSLVLGSGGVSLRTAENHTVEKVLIAGKSIMHRRSIISGTATRHLYFIPFARLCIYFCARSCSNFPDLFILCLINNSLKYCIRIYLSIFTKVIRFVMQSHNVYRILSVKKYSTVAIQQREIPYSCP